MKKCTKCNEYKTLDLFCLDKRRKDGLGSHCRSCNFSYSNNYKEYRKNYWSSPAGKERKQKQARKLVTKRSAKNWHLKNNYNLTIAQYDIMCASQQDVCAICHKKNARAVCLSVDHDHTTGKIRQLLCDKCNRALGLFCDSIEVIHSAFLYLTKHKGKV